MAKAKLTLEEVQIGTPEGITNKYLEDMSSDDLQKFGMLVEAAERYEDMAAVIKILIQKKLKTKEVGKESVLTADERNLFSVAYKQCVGKKRSAVRMFKSDDMKEQNDIIGPEYTNTARWELYTSCKEVIEILESLSKRTLDTKGKSKEEAIPIIEEKVFYAKMMGDYYRYLCEEFCASDDIGKETKDALKAACQKSYDNASESTGELLETHPTRLGLALNRSVAYYEVLEKKEEAIKIARNAFQKAIEQLDSLNDTSYKDATLIMQLLRDNLTIWDAEVGPDAPKEDPDKDIEPDS